MKLLSKSNSIFSLKKSDDFVGSLISKSDAEMILDVNDLSYLYADKKYMDENVLRKHWYDNNIKNCIHKHRNGNIITSFDELILSKIMKLTYPSLKIEQQVKFDGKKYVDFLLNLNGKKKLVEFMGPHHFINNHNVDNFPTPFDRKKLVEDHFGIECVIWPYWIQRCELNVKIIFDENFVDGLGALWSTNSFFGDFDFDNSDDIIINLCRRFGASRNGIGYFYEGSDVTARWENKLEHPIVQKILNGKADIKRLLPKGKNPNFKATDFLPSSLCKLIKS